MSDEQHRHQQVRTIAEQRRRERGPLLPILHEVMEEFGYIDTPDVATIADVLNLSVAEVHGVVSFYADFRTTPPKAHTVALCRAEACQSVGGQQVFDQTVAAFDGSDDVEVEQVFCFGNCALGPAGMIDGRLRGRLDAAAVRAELEAVR